MLWKWIKWGMSHVKKTGFFIQIQKVALSAVKSEYQENYKILWIFYVSNYKVCMSRCLRIWMYVFVFIFLLLFNFCYVSAFYTLH